MPQPTSGRAATSGVGGQDGPSSLASREDLKRGEQAPEPKAKAGALQIHVLVRVTDLVENK